MREIRALGIGDIEVSGWPASRVAALARYGATAKAQAVAQMPDARRMSTLLATARQPQVCALDDALDLLDRLLEILSRVKMSAGRGPRRHARAARPGGPPVTGRCPDPRRGRRDAQVVKTLRINKSCCDVTLDFEEGWLLFVPRAFVWPQLAVIHDTAWQPTIIYPAPGVGTLW